MNPNPPSCVHFSEEAKTALAQDLPVVALESSIISQGMPFPENVDTALELESIIRGHGVIPATVGLIEGTIQIGLTAEQIERFGKSSGVCKVTRRDLPVLLSKRQLGATTVSATIFCAHLAGIEVVVTGGIGGVHRGGQSSLDVSADLTELAHTPVVVVSAGVKSVLDIGRTLEVLETLGVLVLGFQTDQFPAFYCRESGLVLEHLVEGAEQAADSIRKKRELGDLSGVLIANPVPQKDALDPKEVERHIRAARSEAAALHISGKAVTPFLLKKLVERTGGRSLKCNIALVKHNAQVGAEIAKALCVHKVP